MANKVFHSSTVTFLDRTDERKLEVYISSNNPTIQIYNNNTNEYTPDWSVTNLQLRATVYLDSTQVTPATVQWYTRIGTTETLVGSNATLTVSANALATNPIITYICRATYQNVSAVKEITFARTDTGKNGKDGTSVNIKGTATSVSEISNTDYYTITYNGSDISAAQLNDAYMYNGDLYVCVDSRDGVDYFINVGRIQGPKGEDAKNIIVAGDAQVFKVSKTNAITPATISVTAYTFNTTATTWTYSVNGGVFQTDAPTGVVRNGNVVTVTGATLSANSLTIKASDGTYSDVFTIYKAYDGADGNPGQPAPMAFLTNENISFVANSSGQVALTSFTTNVVAYNGTTKTTPVLGTITGLPTGMTVSTPVTTSNELILTFSIANNSTLGATTSNSGTITIPVTSPVSTNLKLSWSKINTGATGVGINSTQVKYGVSASATTQPTTWSDSLPTAKDGEYLWTRTIIDYTDPSKEDTVTYTYAKQGTPGIQGNPGTSVTVSSIQYQEGASATIAPTGTWSNAVVAVADGRYLWTKTVFSDGTTSYGVAKQGSSGTPASVVSITPSSLYFKSTTGQNGVFTPDYIYLYPRLQTVSYSNWQYSIDGGGSWVSASGANGLTIGTYGSVANSLRISNTSTLYTKDVTSISFRCNSTNAAVYDIISIAKIYDVVDLQIGGRNLLRWTQGLPITATRNGPDGISAYNAGAEVGLLATDNGVKLQFNSTSSDAISVPLASDGCVENGETYTLSFDYRGNITSPGTLFFLQRTTPNSSINLAAMSTLVANETDWQHYEATFSSATLNDRVNYQILLFYGLQSYTIDNWIEVKKESLKLEKGNKKTAWTPAIEDTVGTPGAAGADAVTFQVYSSTGYALSTNMPTATLQTFAYIGDVEISAGAVYQWYEYGTSDWVAISGATDSYLTVDREDVAFSKSYKCIMTFNDAEYTGVVTLDDKNDANKVFTEKPSNYTAGDIWIVGVDYAPSGVEVGTLLRAEHTNATYEDADWVTSLKYDKAIADLQENIETYNQYFSFDSVEGLKISAKDDNGTPSQFSTSLTNERLSFNYGNEAIAYINGTKMNIKEAEIESPLTVTGKYSGSTMLQAPVINIGNFSIIVESNGSLSIVANT